MHLPIQIVGKCRVLAGTGDEKCAQVLLREDTDTMTCQCQAESNRLGFFLLFSLCFLWNRNISEISGTILCFRLPVALSTSVCPQPYSPMGQFLSSSSFLFSVTLPFSPLDSRCRLLPCLSVGQWKDQMFQTGSGNYRKSEQGTVREHDN